ncbi:MAG: PAS domain-containing protein [Actinobacteria bacterium]|uniref:Unannotated protein n=2 Tax=freshwater metagenome TaxID=449393 RepID=A0A6J6SJ56_9ZZZZ|nr:PAS domain-containing protein [Actinomycetota bacterium]MSZ83821.1 PAS domain-containing protein [Actinomycetota bacterium]MTB18910.1 PAS domain-containing protein [Actinomycetota bacterium]
MTEASAEPLHLLGQLDASVALLRPLMSESNTVVDAHVVWANAKAESVWGSRVGALASAVCPDFDEWIAAANTAWRGTSVRRLIETDHGRVGWTRAVSSVSRIDGHLAEVTTDRSADQELIDRLAALDRHYRNLLAELPVTVVVARPDRDEFEFLSPNATELTGRPMGDIDRRSTFRALLHPDDRPHLDTVASLLPKGGEADIPGRIIRPDGSERRVDARAVLTGTSHDRDRRILITMLDVTERHATELKAQQSERLEGLARTAGLFAHQFSSLLQVIGGNLEHMERATEGPNDPLTQSLAAIARAGLLVSGLMAFASGQPGAVEPVSVPDVLHDVDAMLRSGLPAAAGLSIDIADGVPDVLMAAEALRVVVFKIIHNAAASLPEGGSVHIDVRACAEARCHLSHRPEPGHWVRIAVTDNGYGITADRLNQVWEPFNTSLVGTDALGAGLGLSIVHGVLHQYDGHLTLDSSPSGTTVSLYLPAADG